MIIEMDDREIEVDEEDLSSLLEMLNKQYDPTIIMMTKTAQEPVKRIVVGYIERGNNGLIKSCVLDVER
jgi:hypothetical protein